MLIGLVSTWSPPLIRTTAPTLVPPPISTPPPWINHASLASSWPSGSGARSAAMLLIAFFNNSSKARTHSSCECLYSRTTTGAAFRPLPLIGSSPRPLREAEDVPLRRCELCQTSRKSIVLGLEISSEGVLRTLSQEQRAGCPAVGIAGAGTAPVADGERHPARV